MKTPSKFQRQLKAEVNIQFLKSGQKDEQPDKYPDSQVQFQTDKQGWG